MTAVSKFFKNLVVAKGAKTGLVLLAPIVFAALAADFITIYNPLRTGVGPMLSPPSLAYPFGTDQAGSDVYSQVIYGARVALYVGVVSTLIALVIALAVGLPAGFYGGVLDEALMRATDVVLSIPSFVLIIFIVILFGSNIHTITLVIGVVSWPTLARIIRAQILSLKEREFVLAVRAVGAGSVDIMVNEILPNIWLPLLPAVTLQMGSSILVEAGLSFLGLGDPNVVSWGRILWLASRSIYLGAWWSILTPGLFIIITILAFNLLGDAISQLTSAKKSVGV